MVAGLLSITVSGSDVSTGGGATATGVSRRLRRSGAVFSRMPREHSATLMLWEGEPLTEMSERLESLA